MNAITLRNGKKLEELKGTHGEVEEGLLKDKGKEMLEENGHLVLENGEKDKDEETTKASLGICIGHWFLSLKGLSWPNLRPSLGNF